MAPVGPAGRLRHPGIRGGLRPVFWRLPRRPGGCYGLSREMARYIVEGGVLHGLDLRENPHIWLDGIVTREARRGSRPSFRAAAATSDNRTNVMSSRFVQPVLVISRRSSTASGAPSRRSSRTAGPRPSGGTPSGRREPPPRDRPSGRPPVTTVARGGRLTPGWPYDGPAATGIGGSVRSEVRELGMELERDPVAVVTLRYDFRPLVPPPVVGPGFAPEPRRERGRQTRPEDVDCPDRRTVRCRPRRPPLGGDECSVRDIPGPALDSTRLSAAFVRL
jgi:hypothetical protein